MSCLKHKKADTPSASGVLAEASVSSDRGGRLLCFNYKDNSYSFQRVGIKPPLFV